MTQIHNTEIHNISVEFFPPKTDEGIAKLRETRKQLGTVKPAFMSVTFGAGGSTRDRTMDTVLEIQAEGFNAAPHISGISSSKSEICKLINTYKDKGINRLVVLRGDVPSGEVSSGEFKYGSELVAFIRQETGEHFHIEVAAYPEFHPESRSPNLDLAHFAEKVHAGANSAITQYFYNAEAYYNFMDECAKRNINIPVVPGIMPIYNITQLSRFSASCGADIPRWLRLKLEDYGDDLVSLKAFGLEVVRNLCANLLKNGAPGLHFYSMNQSETIKKVVQGL